MTFLTALVGFGCIASFFVFVWLSHLGILTGMAASHFWGGIGLFVMCVGGTILLGKIDEKSTSKFVPLLFCLSALTAIGTAIAYIFLVASGASIGPVLANFTSSDAVLIRLYLGTFYLILAGVGALILYFYADQDA